MNWQALALTLRLSLITAAALIVLALPLAYWGQRLLLALRPPFLPDDILDLAPEKSFIKWCVDQGMTVFLMSWVNPDEKLSHKDFADYMREGPLTALDKIEEPACYPAFVLTLLMTATRRNEAAAQRKRDGLKAQFGAALGFMEPGMLIGTPGQVIDRIGQYVKGGAEWIMLALRAPFDVEGLQVFIDEVMPAFS